HPPRAPLHPRRRQTPDRHPAPERRARAPGLRRPVRCLGAQRRDRPTTRRTDPRRPAPAPGRTNPQPDQPDAGSSPARRRDRPRPPRPARRRPCHRHPDPDRRTARTTLEHPRLNPGARRRAPRSPAGSTPWTLQQPTAKRRPAVKSSPTGPRAARREAVTLDSRGKRSYPATELLLLSHPTPRCPPTTAPACSNSTALNRVLGFGWFGGG